MILQRLSTALRKQDWVTVSIETLIVIFGVFIGIEVANWNEARQERAEQREVEQRLHEDVRLLDEALIKGMQYQRDIIVALHTLQTAIERGAALEGEDEVIRYGLVHGRSYPSFVRKSTTYTELVSSGRLHLIRDGALRTALALYHERIENNLYDLEQIRSPINNEFLNLTTHATFAPLDLDTLAIQDAVAFDLEGMMDDELFRKRLDMLIIFQTWAYANLERQRVNLDTVIDALGEAT